jgi:hypothetical protein
LDWSLNSAEGRSEANRRSLAPACTRSEGRYDVPRPTADQGRRNSRPQGLELAPVAEPLLRKMKWIGNGITIGSLENLYRLQATEKGRDGLMI